MHIVAFCHIIQILSHTPVSALIVFFKMAGESSTNNNDPQARSVLTSGGCAAIAASNHQASGTGGCSTSHANTNNNNSATTIFRLNKFVRRLYDMVKAEQDKGVVEWRRGLLVLHSTATFTKHILPKFFNTRNFKTFRRQLNYYGFVDVRSFSNTAAATTTALWVHQELAAAVHQPNPGGSSSGSSNGSSNNNTLVVNDPDDLSLILTLRRVEPNEDHKTVEGRRQRKVMALNTVEEDLQVSTSFLQRQQIQSLLNSVISNRISSSSSSSSGSTDSSTPTSTSPPPQQQEQSVVSSPPRPAPEATPVTIFTSSPPPPSAKEDPVETPRERECPALAVRQVAPGPDHFVDVTTTSTPGPNVSPVLASVHKPVVPVTRPCGGHAPAQSRYRMAQKGAAGSPKQRVKRSLVVADLRNPTITR